MIHMYHPQTIHLQECDTMENPLSLPNPFPTEEGSGELPSLIPNTPIIPVTEEDTLEEVNAAGHIIVYRMEGTVKVQLEDKGHIRDEFKRALYKAARMRGITLENLVELRKQNISLMEQAAIQLALNAAHGNSEAITQLFDRILGKPKQVVENKNLNLTIDDVLSRAVNDDGSINLQTEGDDEDG